MNDGDIERFVDELLKAKLDEEREVELERLKHMFEPIAMQYAASVSAFQLFGFSRTEAMGIALEYFRLFKEDMTGGKKHGK